MVPPYTRCPVGGQLVIQPMGDSITAGPVAAGGYRSTLLRMLADARGGDVGPSGVVDSWGDMLNASYGYGAECGSAMSGHPNTSAAQWVSNGWMATFDPVPSLVADVHFGLLWLGANDAGDTSADNLLTLADQFLGLHPLSNLFVGNRLPRSFAGTTVWNASLAAGIAARRTAGKNVVLVDLNAVVPLGELPDGLHPNATANLKIAERWYSSMAPFVRP